MMYAVKPIYKVRLLVGCRLLLIGRVPNNRSQDRRISLPNTMLAGIMLVVSWGDAVYTSRKTGSLSSQYF
jgi:hypothetical protein